MIIKKGTVLHVDRLYEPSDLRIRDGRIESIGENIKGDASEQVIDAEDCYVLPGLIDIHTHGLKNVMVDHGSLIDFSGLQFEQGVTTCLATLGGTLAKNIATMQKGFEESDDFKKTPNIAGFRPEITYLADASAGNPESLTAITAETTDALFKAGRGWIKIWDISPELPGALDFIRWAKRHGIITSLAHSSALEDTVRPAVDAGMSLVTHFYDLFPLPMEVDEGVYPAGVTDYINLEDRLTVELIPDGVHVHPYLLEQTLRIKGLDRAVFITDSALGSGNPPGIYDGLYPGIQVEVTDDRGIRRVGDDLLSCSALTMLSGFRNAVLKFGKSIPEASRLCARNAARILGLDSKGCLAAGMDADIIIVDRKLNLLRTIARGESVYSGI